MLLTLLPLCHQSICILLIKGECVQAKMSRLCMMIVFLYRRVYHLMVVELFLMLLM